LELWLFRLTEPVDVTKKKDMVKDGNGGKLIMRAKPLQTGMQGKVQKRDNCG
jgi:hypothetical protein